VAGLVAAGGRGRRIELRDTRLRGVTWARCLLDDVRLEGVEGTDVSFRFSTLRRTIVTDCVLAGLDLTEVQFDRVLLQRCDLRGATFAAARVQRLRIEGCDLSGASGLGALSGASVHPDVMTMAVGLASAAGIRVTAEE
jgi:uncharacterized protein YjbI with pentapeptide repeats